MRENRDKLVTDKLRVGIKRGYQESGVSVGIIVKSELV